MSRQGGDRARAQPACAVEVAGQEDRTFADGSIGVAEGADHERFRKLLRRRQKVQGVQSGERVRGGLEQAGELGARAAVAAFVEQARGRVAVPTVGVRERLDKLGRGRLGQVDRGTADPVLVVRDQAIDASAVVAVVQVKVLLDLVGDGPRVLDHLAIHIADMEAAVGGVGEIDHADPGVAAGGELEAAFVGGSFAGEADAVGGGSDHLAMDELTARVAREAVVPEGRAIGVAAVDCRARRASEVTAYAPAAFDAAGDRAGDAPARAHDAPRLIRADAEDFGRGPVLGDALTRRGQRKVGVRRRPSAVVDPILQVVGVGAAELPAEIIEAHPILGAAGFESERMGQRVEPEIIAAEFERGELGAEQAGHLPAVAAAGEQVDALVGSPLQAVGHPLDVDDLQSRAEAREDLLAMVGHAFAGAVLEAPEIRRRQDVKAAVGPEESRGPGKVVGEDAARLIVTVAVLVFEDRDATKVGDFVPALRVIDHLADEHAPAFVEADRDRVADLRFMRRQLQPEARLYFPCREGVLGLDGGVARQLLGGVDFRRAFGPTVGFFISRRSLDAVRGAEQRAERCQRDHE